MTTTAQAPTLRRAVVLMTASSFLVPAGGLLTAPLLARALSTDGRGELAAAIAPAGLMLAAATLGLPDALTYFLAKRPGATRPALAWASLVTVALGLVCLLATFLALSFLSAGDPDLGRLILLATALTVPALVVNVFRGAATGRQMWGAIAVERVIITAIRVLGFGLLFVGGELGVLAGVLVNTVTPIVAGIVYWPLLRRPQEATEPAEAAGDPADLPDDENDRGTLATIVAFGSKVWLGSVASMVLARASQLLMTPLSSVEDLGLYTVASTVSDLPLIVALAIQGALFGVNSKTRDASQLTGTARLTLLVAFGGCLVLGASLPFWIGPLFGYEFEAATVPTLMLLVSALICIPGLLAGTALSAWGRPGLRSAGLGVTLAANVGSFVLLVPHFGVYGAAWTSIISNVVLATFMVVAARQVVGVPGRDFFLVRRSDVVRAWTEGQRILARLPLGGRS
ncbi:oligosaccharide flippase family protein [uncultured Friedmanniella sp.]|uniref:oligosaccharide flippase family protein n=1 Tax=uncultured Friedmanniella sp. TaxID=335381 RepID=UPI0035CB2102